MREIARMGIIQIDVTSWCDGPACSNCTRLLPHHGCPRYEMDLRVFRRAAQSLAGYPGVVGVFGGNPLLHTQFVRLTEILTEVRPDITRRGLWTNNWRGREGWCWDRYGYINYNPHGAQATGYVRTLRRGPDGRLIGRLAPFDASNIRHHPALVAIEDLVPDAKTRRLLIDACPVQNRWSACVTPTIAGRGGVYACEVAAAWDYVLGADHSLPLEDGWWRRPLSDFRPQLDAVCNRCGMALPLPGRRDTERMDDCSASNEPLLRVARARRLWRAEEYDLAAARVARGDPLDYAGDRASAPTAEGPT